MLAREVMTSPVVTVRRTDPVRRAVRVLHEHGITAAPVVDTQGRLVGIVSELDLLRGEFQPDPRAHARPVQAVTEPAPRRVSQVMTPKPVSVTETADVTTVIDLMVHKRVKSLPVVRGHLVVGMVSRRDLLALLARPDAELRSDVVRELREQYPYGPTWQVSVRDGVCVLRGPAHEQADQVAGLIARTVPGVVRVNHVRSPS